VIGLTDSTGDSEKLVDFLNAIFDKAFTFGTINAISVVFRALLPN
jgi:hypothetical protein